MNKVKNKKTNKLIPILCIILGILIVICIGVYISKDDEQDKQVAKNQQEQSLDEKEEMNENDKVDEEVKEEVVEEKSEDAVQKIDSYEIETDYGKLYFPKTWEDQIEVKYTNDAGYKAEFYGSVKGKDAVHLFDVCFNSDDGFLLGYIQNEDEIINISIDMKELEFDDSWEQEKIDEIYAMQEDMNFLMQSLSKIENYVEP